MRGQCAWSARCSWQGRALQIARAIRARRKKGFQYQIDDLRLRISPTFTETVRPSAAQMRARTRKGRLTRKLQNDRRYRRPSSRTSRRSVIVQTRLMFVSLVVIPTAIAACARPATSLRSEEHTSEL